MGALLCRRRILVNVRYALSGEICFQIKSRLPSRLRDSTESPNKKPLAWHDLVVVEATDAHGTQTAQQETIDLVDYVVPLFVDSEGPIEVYVAHKPQLPCAVCEALAAPNRALLKNAIASRLLCAKCLQQQNKLNHDAYCGNCGLQGKCCPTVVQYVCPACSRSLRLCSTHCDECGIEGWDHNFSSLVGVGTWSFVCQRCLQPDYKR